MKSSRLVCGVGVNDADYIVQVKEYLGKINGKHKSKHIWTCPFYTTWKNLLQRCYSESQQLKQPTYEDCFVCREWLLFSNFRKWMVVQDWEGNFLDKDILLKNNKEYSPENCIFISRDVNNFITDRSNHRGSYPIGVILEKTCGRFRADCSGYMGKKRYIGVFKSPEEAHKAWLKEKLKIAILLASNQDDPRVAKALIDRYENYVQS